MKIDAKSDASNGKFVTDMAANDVLKYAYHADKAGTYQVVMRYRSGLPKMRKIVSRLQKQKERLKTKKL